MQNSSVVSLLRERAGLQPDPEKLSERTAERRSAETGAPLLSYGMPKSPTVRIVDPDTRIECPAGTVGRMKDLLIVYGRNHHPEDIESTVQEITGGRVAAICVPVDQAERLVTIVELKKRADSAHEKQEKLDVVKNDVTAAISKSHGLNVADLVLVAPGSIPTATSGEIRRAACVVQYRRRQFTRLAA